MSGEAERVTGNTPMLNAALRALSRDLILRGVLETLAGVLLMLKPLQTATVVTVVVGVFLLIDGATLLAVAMRSGAYGRKLMIVSAAVLLLLGALTVWRPIMMDSLWVVMLGVWQIFSGVECLAGGGRRFWSVLSGVLSLVVGVIFIASPFAGLLSLLWLIGILLLASGVITIIAGTKFRV